MLRFCLMFCFYVLISNPSFSSNTYFQPPNQITDWKIKCQYGKETITGTGGSRIFKTSPNYCNCKKEINNICIEGSKILSTGIGQWEQRAELITKNGLSVKSKVNYIFKTKFSFISNNNEKFSIFQIHDDRNKCAPPLKVDIGFSGRLSFASDYIKNNFCISSDLQTHQMGKTIIKRDGTEYELKVLLFFDGKGGFIVEVYLDDNLEISGIYTPPTGKEYFKSKFFRFNHGVYSKKIFDYEMKSDFSMTKANITPTIDVSFLKNLMQEKSSKYDRSKQGLNIRFSCLFNYLLEKSVSSFPTNQDLENLIKNIDLNKYYWSHQIIELGFPNDFVEEHKIDLMYLLNYEGTNEEFCNQPYKIIGN